jgi:hypothetical protein
MMSNRLKLPMYFANQLNYCTSIVPNTRLTGYKHNLQQPENCMPETLRKGGLTIRNDVCIPKIQSRTLAARFIPLHGGRGPLVPSHKTRFEASTELACE